MQWVDVRPLNHVHHRPVRRAKMGNILWIGGRREYLVVQA
jgi:hypothetical protein